MTISEQKISARDCSIKQNLFGVANRGLSSVFEKTDRIVAHDQQELMQFH